MKKLRVILAGGSGSLGRSLATRLVPMAYDVVVLSRSPGSARPGLRFVPWDGRTLGDWAPLLDGSRALINLTGRSVNCRHTPENRAEILSSRIDSVRVLGEAIASCTEPPEVFVQAGSLAIYGNAGDRTCAEDAPHGSGFPAMVCERWEAAFSALDLPRTRKVLLRIGIALKRGEGGSRMLESLTRRFLGGTVGNGRQFISWVHIADLEQMFLWALERDDIRGTFNATGTAPMTNADFMREMRRAVHRPWAPPAPAWLARIGAWAMRTEAELGLHGFRCVPRRFQDHGFAFQYPDLRSALQDLYALDKPRTA